MREFFGVDAVVLVFASVNGPDVERVGQDEAEAGGLASIGQPVPPKHAFTADGEAVLVGLDEFEEVSEVVVLDVGVDQLLAWRSMRQTYIWRACRSIPQLNSVVEV